MAGKNKTVHIVFLILVLGLTANGQNADGKITFRFLRIIGSQGDKPGQFLSPSACSTDPEGNLYVTDTGNNRIQKFDRSGKLVAFIGGFGWEKEHFQRPIDICAENGLDVYVADYENRRIERYDKDLNWISSLYSNPTADERLQFGFPNSVSLSIHGDLFLVDDENKRILKLNTLKEPVLSFGDFDWGQGALVNPRRIVISSRDRVYVSDRNNKGRIVVFDYYGNYLFEFGAEVLQSPVGLCIGKGGFLFVADADQDQIFAFELNGHFVQSFGSSGAKYGSFNRPGDVAVHGNKLFVVDSNNHRIQVFEVVY